MASTAAASRMSTEWVRTRPPCLSLSSLAVSSSTPPRRPASHRSAPSSRYLAAISLPRAVPPPVMRMRFPLSRPSLNMRAPWKRAHSKGCELRQGDRGDDERHADRREQGVALCPGDMRDQHPAEGRAERLAEV